MKTILVAIDFSSVTPFLLNEAVAMARAFDASIRLIHVEPPDPDFVGYEPGPHTVREAVADELRADHRHLHKLEGEVQEKGVAASSLFIQGPTVEKLLQAAVETGAELIVMGSHGHGALHHLLVGSVSEGVLRDAPCPLLLVPSPRGNHA